MFFGFFLMYVGLFCGSLLTHLAVIGLLDLRRMWMGVGVGVWM